MRAKGRIERMVKRERRMARGEEEEQEEEREEYGGILDRRWFIHLVSGVSSWRAADLRRKTGEAVIAGDCIVVVS